MHMTSQLLSNCSIALHFLVSISAHVVLDKKLQYQSFYYSASICFIIVRNARRDVLACLNIRHFFLFQLFYSKKYICKYSYNKKSFFTEGNIVFRVNCTLKCEKIQRLFSKYRTEKNPSYIHVHILILSQLLVNKRLFDAIHRHVMKTLKSGIVGLYRGFQFLDKNKSFTK